MDGVHSVAQMGSIGQSSERRYKKPAASLCSGGPIYNPWYHLAWQPNSRGKLRDRLPSLSLESQNADKEDELPSISSHQYQHLMLRPVITEGYRRRLLTGRRARDASGRSALVLRRGSAKLQVTEPEGGFDTARDTRLTLSLARCSLHRIY